MGGRIAHADARRNVLFYRQYLLGEDPTNVERVMLKIRRLGGFKPWGSALSVIEEQHDRGVGQAGPRRGVHQGQGREILEGGGQGVLRLTSRRARGRGAGLSPALLHQEQLEAGDIAEITAIGGEQEESVLYRLAGNPDILDAEIGSPAGLAKPG